MRRPMWYCLMTSCLVLSAYALSSAQEIRKGGQSNATKPAAKAKVGDEASPATKRATRGRLPANWGKLGLSDEQREKIYEIQARYHEQIEQLEEQIERLRTTQQREMLAALTPEQVKELERVTIEAKKKSSARKKASKAKSSGTSGS